MCVSRTWRVVMFAVQRSILTKPRLFVRGIVLTNPVRGHLWIERGMIFSIFLQGVLILVTRRRTAVDSAVRRVLNGLDDGRKKSEEIGKVPK